MVSTYWLGWVQDFTRGRFAEMPEPTVGSILIVFGVIVFASFTMGFSGFGAGILTMAGLSWYVPDPERLSAVSMLISPMIMASIFVTSRREAKVDWAAVGLLYIGMLLGMPIGYGVIQKYGTSPFFIIALGVVLTVFAVNGLVRPKFSKVPFGLGVPLGFAGGFITGAFVSGGPPLVYYLYSREQDPRQAVSSLQVVFLMGTATRIVITESSGPGLSWEIWGWFFAMLPVVIVVSQLAYRFSKKVRAERFTQTVYAIIGIGGIMNLVKGILSL